MQKKNISIIGSCCSRDLFNTYVLADAFTVDRYAFKVCPWDLCSEGLGIDRAELEKITAIPEFTRRMLWYEFNKETLNEVERANKEYLLIDLLNIAHPIDCVTFNGRTVYLQDQYDKISKHFNDLKTNPYFEDLEWKRIEFGDFDLSVVEKGLKRFSEWVSENFAPDRVVIYLVDYARCYYDLFANVIPYPESLMALNAERQKIICDLTQKLSEYLPGTKLMLDVGDKYGAFGAHDVMQPFPPPVHYCIEDYHRQSYEFLKLLDIQPSDFYEHKHQPLCMEYIKVRNQLVSKEKALIELKKQMAKPKLDTIVVKDVSLNDYFGAYEDLDKVIILISAKDEASQKMGRFVNKSLLGLKMDIKYRNSYVGVVDKGRNFAYENASAEKQEYVYKVNGKDIRICSAGFAAGNSSGVFVGESNENISHNRRGLNIVVLNAKTLEVIDSAHCDTNGDSTIQVHSDYFSNLKIKV